MESLLQRLTQPSWSSDKAPLCVTQLHCVGTTSALGMRHISVHHLAPNSHLQFLQLSAVTPFSYSCSPHHPHLSSRTLHCHFSKPLSSVTCQQVHPDLSYQLTFVVPSLTPLILSPTLESEQHNASSRLGMFGLASMLMYVDGPELASNANNQRYNAMSQHHYPPLLLQMHALTKCTLTWSDLSCLLMDTLNFSSVWTDSAVGQRPFLSLLSLLRLLHRHLSMAGYQDSVRHQ